MTILNTVCTCDIETSAFCNNCICDHDMVYGIEGYLAELLLPFNPDAAADAKQEALLDDACYCDDVDICPPCARELLARQRILAVSNNVCYCGYQGTCAVCEVHAFVTDTTPAIAMTPGQLAAYETEYGEDIYGRTEDEDLPF